MPGVQKPHWSAFSARNACWELCERAAPGQALDRLDLHPFGLNGEHQTATDEPAVHAHRARATYAVLAADVRAGEAQLVAKEVDQVLPRLDVTRDQGPVHGEGQFHARASTRVLTTRASNTPARCRRRAGEP